MKKIFGFLSALVLAAGLIGCSDDDTTSGGPIDGVQVYFATDATNTFTLALDTSSVEVELLRIDTRGELDVPVTLTPADPEYAALFTAPSSVIFADGEASALYRISYDRSLLEEGASYEFELAIDDPTLTSPYALASLTLSLKMPLPLVRVGGEEDYALFRDDCITTFYGVGNDQYQCEVYTNEKQPGYLYLKNVYTSLYPYNDPGDYVEGDQYLVIKVDIESEKDTEVSIPAQYIGMDWGYGEFAIASIENGTYENGVITFPMSGLVVSMANYNGGAWYYANSNGAFRVIMPGVSLADLSLDVTYAGFTATADETTYPAFALTYGVDVASINYAFFDGNIANNYADELAGMLDGSIESYAFEVSGLGSDQFTSEQALEPGTYTLVIVPTDIDGVIQGGSSIAVSFKFKGIGNAEINPLEEEYTSSDDFIGFIEKEDLFKTWIMWGVDYDDKDGITDRQPIAYVTFSENEDADFEEDGYEYDMIDIQGFSPGATEDDTHQWEYYDGVILNFYMHENLGAWRDYYVNYAPFIPDAGSYGFLDEIMMGGLVDEGYMALVYSGWYNLGNNPEPSGFAWNAYEDEACTKNAGYFMRIYNIMFEDPAVSSLSAKAASLKAPKAAVSKNELKSLAQSLSIRENYVETARGMAHRKIDEMRAAQASRRAAKYSIEILERSNRPTQGNVNKQVVLGAVMAQ